MAVVAGIDEAGYGPLLGPLVVTGVAFEVPDDAIGDCLWRRLSGSVTRVARGRDRRLPIADSKKLYQRKSGFKMLERTALVMASVAGVSASSGREWLQRVAPGGMEGIKRYPWYRDFDWALPLENDARDIALRAHAVRRDLAACGMGFVAIDCELLLEGHFNDLVEATRNKAVASLGLVLRIVSRLAQSGGAGPVRICIDRQGGRRHYRPALMTAFAGRGLRIVSESEERSAYRLDGGPRPLEIEFRTSGEDAYLPVALASVFSKYVRELFMTALNRYWSARVDGLCPTAGYYQDAQRFLAHIAPAIEREGVRRSLLVRSR